MAKSELPYLNFLIPPDLLKRINDFRFKHRFPTRAAAIKMADRMGADAEILARKSLVQRKPDEHHRGRQQYGASDNTERGRFAP